ncbi:MAG TPA: Rieske 2Fe-2S domain-containing protein [Acidobacteriota bacterium]|nr:Rieske 2Fe-2S domain-containing protein [Acidobacteriota bacterium]
MGVAYKAVQWTGQKKSYDLWMLLGIVLYLGAFLGTSFALFPNITIETALIRSLGTAAFLLLHVILSIGPLSRIDRRFLPLLYNRRHMGVTLFVLALAHGTLSLIQFHAFGELLAPVSVFVSNTAYGSLIDFPFQTLGFFALLILFLMAATSHDFWLNTLTPPVWKSLHMLVYVAYGLLVMHVALGILQDETSPWLGLLLTLGVVWIVGVHLTAAQRERRLDREMSANPEGWVDAGSPDEIEEKRAKIITVQGERVALFRYDGKLSAVSNVCRHQGGPLGEGKIVDGCITCPWHGFQYRPESGDSPPPFSEKIPTFNLRLSGGRIQIHHTPNPPGTRVEPIRLDAGEEADHE